MSRGNTPTPRELEQAAAAGKAAFQHAGIALRTSKGVNFETAATALGAFAGWACQAAALDGLRTKDPSYAGLSLAEITTSDGGRFYSGDAINAPLAEKPYSVWNLVSAATPPHGQLPDLAEIFRHAASVIGSPEFGIPRDWQLSAVSFSDAWPLSRDVVRRIAKKTWQWPIAYGAAIQELFRQHPTGINFTVTARIVMDSAVATSKVPLGDLY